MTADRKLWRVRFSVVALALLALLAVLGARAGELGTGARSFLLSLAICGSTALAIGVPLGSLAGSGPRIFDTLLRFVADLVGSVPTLLVLAALTPGSRYSSVAVCLGVLRGIELASLLASELIL